MGIDQRLRMQEAATLLGGTPQRLRTWSTEGYIEAIAGKGGITVSNGVRSNGNAPHRSPNHCEKLCDLLPGFHDQPTHEFETVTSPTRTICLS